MDFATLPIAEARRHSFLASAVLLARGALAFSQTETVIHTFQSQAGKDGYYPEN